MESMESCACTGVRGNASPGRVRRGRSRRLTTRRRSISAVAPRASTASTDLVARVAALIPAPMTELGADLAAWAAFDELVDEAARLVADSLGPASTLELEGLLTAPIGVDPVCQRLVLQTLAALRSGHRA